MKCPKAGGAVGLDNHVDCMMGWTTREQPTNSSTKGAIRIKHGRVSIDKEGVATIEQCSETI